MKLSDKSCQDFVSAVGSKEPAPGGGGVSALAGALGMALGNMVGCLTTGKQKYKQYENDIQRLMEESEVIQNKLLLLIDEDAEGFRPLAECYKMPVNSESERAEKENIIEIAMLNACKAPIEIMRCCCDALNIIEEFAEKGSKLALSDAGSGAIICKSALQSASLNVFINTKDMKNRDTAEALNMDAEDMLKTYTLKADEIYAYVYNSLRKGEER